jgi:6,7-dimethyl-8-ribityllumazine synthase
MPQPRKKSPKSAPAPELALISPLPPVAVIVSRYNHAVTGALLAGALQAYAQAGGAEGGCDVFDAPGSFEVVTLADHAAATRRYAGVVALGCIVKGQTRHDEYLAHAVTGGLVHVGLRHALPVTNGVLTVNSQAQALARAGARSDHNKGHEAMTALLAVLASIQQVQNRAGARPRSKGPR